MQIAPFPSATDASALPGAEIEALRARGMDLIRGGKAAVVVLGGGQGTRLGFDKPKGMYDIGMPSGKTLFRVQADKLHRLRFLAAEGEDGADGDPDEVHILWVVMTSPFTDAETRAYFERESFFGLPRADVLFVCQATLPCLSPEGRIMMASPSRVATAPNGNGGVYEALSRGGAIEEMRRRGTEAVYMYCVDNVLAKVCDPCFLGFIAREGAAVVNKTVLKEEPHEKVGVMCLRGGAPSVVEYSEISKEMAEARDGAGLLYRHANIANHGFSLDFLARMAEASLPFHLAHKKIPTADDPAPAAPNGYKLETFVFDVFAEAGDSCLAYSVPRRGEFAPLKNAPGPGVRDSPVTARADVARYHASLVERAGGEVRLSEAGDGFELSPLLSYDGEGLEERVAGKQFVAPCVLDERE